VTLQKFVTAFQEDHAVVLEKFNGVKEGPSLGKLTSKLNDWIGQVEKQIQQIERKLRKKISALETQIQTDCFNEIRGRKNSKFEKATERRRSVSVNDQKDTSIAL
jgi:plasmid maintenance system killer protein